jgi:hypothetical protein
MMGWWRRIRTIICEKYIVNLTNKTMRFPVVLFFYWLYG